MLCRVDIPDRGVFILCVVDMSEGDMLSLCVSWGELDCDCRRPLWPNMGARSTEVGRKVSETVLCENVAAHSCARVQSAT